MCLNIQDLHIFLSNLNKYSVIFNLKINSLSRIRVNNNIQKRLHQVDSSSLYRAVLKKGASRKQVVDYQMQLQGVKIIPNK